MREYCLVREDKIIYGPCPWNGRDFARKAAGALVAIAGHNLKVPIPMIPPADWLNLESGLRIVRITHDIPFYDPFYQVPVVQGDEVQETCLRRVYSIRDRDLNEVRTSLLSRLRQEAAKRLKNTDWMVIRQLEPEGAPIPPAIMEYRRAIRATSNLVEAALFRATNVDELKEAIKASWPLPPIPEEMPSPNNDPDNQDAFLSD